MRAIFYVFPINLFCNLTEDLYKPPKIHMCLEIFVDDDCTLRFYYYFCKKIINLFCLYDEKIY